MSLSKQYSRGGEASPNLCFTCRKEWWICEGSAALCSEVSGLKQSHQTDILSVSL